MTDTDIVERLRAPERFPPQTLMAEAADEIERLRSERERCAQIVCEEWHRAVNKFGLLPGTPTEEVVARCLNRIRIPELSTGKCDG